MAKGVTRLRYVIPVVNGENTFYVDLQHGLSRANRKLHRQMGITRVAGGLIHDSNNAAFVRFNAAPNYWATKQAIKRGFRIWKKQRAMVLKDADTGNVTGKWSDFKVHLNNASVSSYLVPQDAGGNDLPAGEWNYSTLVTNDVKWNDPGLIAAANLDKDSFDLMIVGNAHAPGAGTGQDTWSRISLLKSYIDTRGVVLQDPSPPAELQTDPLTNLFDESDTDDEVLQNVNEEGDRPPYDEDVMWGEGQLNGSNGNNLQRMSLAHCSAENPTVRFAGFDALCGLTQLRINSTGSGTVELLIDVYTESMSL
jgi:hypothetical protein